MSSQETNNSATMEQTSMTRQMKTNLKIFISGLLFSNFGDSILFIVMMVWAKELTGYAAIGGIMSWLTTFPKLFGPYFGALADKKGPRSIVVASSVIVAVELLVAAVVLFFFPSVVVLFISCAIYGLVCAALDPATTSLFPRLFAGNKSLFFQAQSASTGINSIFNIFLPAVGTTLYLLFGGVAVLIITAVSLVLSAVTFSKLKIQDLPITESTEDAAEKGKVLKPLKQGWSIICGNKILTNTLVIYFFTSIVLGAIQAPSLAYMSDNLHLDSATLGFILTLQGLGVPVGAFLVQVIQKKVPLEIIQGVALFLTAAMLSLWLLNNLYVTVVGTVVLGISFGSYLVSYGALMQFNTPEDHMGLVMGTTGSISILANTIGIAGSSLLLTAITGHTILGLCVIGFLIIALLQIFVIRSQRKAVA